MSNGESQELNKIKIIDNLLKDNFACVTENYKKVYDINDFLLTGETGVKVTEEQKLNSAQGWFGLVAETLEKILALNVNIKSELEKLNKEVK